jgi:hypothetical protein
LRLGEVKQSRMDLERGLESIRRELARNTRGERVEIRCFDDREAAQIEAALTPEERVRVRLIWPGADGAEDDIS